MLGCACFFAVVLVRLATAATTCPYANLPRAVTSVRVWDEALCSPKSLVWFQICVVDKTTCMQLVDTEAYQAVGDLSKSNHSYVQIESKGSQPMDFSMAVWSNSTTTLYEKEKSMGLPSITRSFQGFPLNASIPSTFQWPKKLTQLWFTFMTYSEIAWPSTLRTLNVQDVADFTFPSTFPVQLEEIVLKYMTNFKFPSNFPPALTRLIVSDVELQAQPLIQFPSTIQLLSVTKCSWFKTTHFSAPLSRLALDTTDITELTLSGVSNLWLSSNGNLTRLKTLQEGRPLQQVAIENMNIKSWTMDTDTFTMLQNTASPRQNFSKTNITIDDASECIRNKGTVRQLFDKDTSGGDYVFTVCVTTQRLSAKTLGGIVAVVVVSSALATFLFYARRQSQTKQSGMPRLQPLKSTHSSGASSQNVEYTHKTDLWSDNSFESGQHLSPSAPQQNWTFFALEYSNEEPSVPIYSPSLRQFRPKANNDIACRAQKEVDVSVETGAAESIGPAMAPLISHQNERASKWPTKVDSNQDRPHHCIVCSDGPQNAACVPCGHNAICMTCAKNILQQRERQCPVCHHHIQEVMRIFHG
ncbi:Aste57867_2486 [Aphanomyces stellatus]|uniref:Aste57867_2486 protein n=1 Tax=Aphanomyces stellatus TaxID=120398 RepID=A0A485KA75_9STRA|nr:hypothetical protein As57867_002479 [Aphanomyces stellatus]VFT79685.1 Aste57867_2486 [Aphanomyces stellatus]